jgi:hypothetical protein
MHPAHRSESARGPGQLFCAKPQRWVTEYGLCSPILGRFLGIIWNFRARKKNEMREAWEKSFYCCNRILLAGFSPQKILKKLFWGQISPGATCREVVRATLLFGSQGAMSVF